MRKALMTKKAIGILLILLMISLALFSCKIIAENPNDPAEEISLESTDNEGEKEPENQPEHTHEYVAQNDENQHYSVCECGAKTEPESHDYEWVIDKEPSYTIVGVQHKECKICGHKTEQNTSITQTHNEDGTLKLDEKLIAELREHFSDIRASSEMYNPSFSKKVTEYPTYSEPVFVKFSKENCYYVIAYFNDDHEYREEEIYVACCREKYTFVGFENLEDIPETYNGEEIIGAFQINLQEFCYDIKANSTDRIIEHYSIFNPEFVNGVCQAPDIELPEQFITFVSEENEHSYYSYDIQYAHLCKSILCIEVDGEYYVYDNRIYEVEGAYPEEILIREFGDYYEQLRAMMISGRYSVTYEYGNGRSETINYAIFKLEDIAELMRSIDTD